MKTISFILACCLFSGPRANSVDTCTAVKEFSDWKNFDPYLIAGIVYTESRFTVTAVNKRSQASGPMQVLPKYSLVPPQQLTTSYIGVLGGVLTAEKWRKRGSKKWVEYYRVGKLCERECKKNRRKCLRKRAKYCERRDTYENKLRHHYLRFVLLEYAIGFLL
jgi:hypothetical protein